MLESPEARAKLRRKLETWPDDRKSPLTINQGLELLDTADKLEQENDRLKIELHDRDSSGGEIVKDMNQLEKEANWMAEFLISQIKTCPTIKAYRCKQLDNTDFPVSECVKCWREAVE